MMAEIHTPNIQIDRLKKRSDFLRLQQSGTKWIAKSMIVQCAPSAGGPAGQIRVGFTVTKKTFPRAVDRNRVRRRLKEAVQKAFLTPRVPGYDYVVIGRTEALAKDFPGLISDLTWCLRKLHAQKPD